MGVNKGREYKSGDVGSAPLGSMSLTFLRIKFVNGTTILNPNNSQLDEFFRSCVNLDDMAMRMSIDHMTDETKMKPGYRHSKMPYSTYTYGTTSKYVIAFSGADKKLFLLDTRDHSTYGFEYTEKLKHFSRVDTYGHSYEIAEMREVARTMPVSMADIDSITRVSHDQMAAERAGMQMQIQQSHDQMAIEREAMRARFDQQMSAFYGETMRVEEAVAARMVHFGTEMRGGLNEVRTTTNQLTNFFYAWVVIFGIAIVAATVSTTNKITDVSNRVNQVDADRVKLETYVRGLEVKVADHHRLAERRYYRAQTTSSPPPQLYSGASDTKTPPASSSWDFGFWNIIAYPLILAGAICAPMLFAATHDAVAAYIA